MAPFFGAASCSVSVTVRIYRPPRHPLRAFLGCEVDLVFGVAKRTPSGITFEFNPGTTRTASARQGAKGISQIWKRKADTDLVRNPETSTDAAYLKSDHTVIQSRRRRMNDVVEILLSLSSSMSHSSPSSPFSCVTFSSSPSSPSSHPLSAVTLASLALRRRQHTRRLRLLCLLCHLRCRRLVRLQLLDFWTSAALSF